VVRTHQPRRSPRSGFARNTCLFTRRRWRCAGDLATQQAGRAIYMTSGRPAGATFSTDRFLFGTTDRYRRPPAAVIVFVAPAKRSFRREIKLIGWRGFQIVGGDNVAHCARRPSVGPTTTHDDISHARTHARTHPSTSAGADLRQKASSATLPERPPLLSPPLPLFPSPLPSPPLPSPFLPSHPSPPLSSPPLSLPSLP